MTLKRDDLQFVVKRDLGWLKRTAIAAVILVAGLVWASSMPDVVVLVAVVLLLGGLIGVIFPIKAIGLTTRGFSASLVVVSFILVGYVVEVEVNALAPLKSSDPDAYLIELREVNETRWRSEMAEMKPEEYAEIVAEEERAAAEAAAEAERIAAERAKEQERVAEAQAAAATEAARREQEQAARAEEDERRSGFHCLSDWDGSHRDFRRSVQNMMRDPDSFEHIETRVTPVDATGKHKIFMEYRARNGFGGMNVGTAVGIYRSDNCTANVIAGE